MSDNTHPFWGKDPIPTNNEPLSPAQQLIMQRSQKNIEALDRINHLAWESTLSFPLVNTFSTSRRFALFNAPEYRLLRKGTMVIGGEASSGKTTLALQMAIDMLLQSPDVCLLFFTLDESLERAKRKVLSLLFANQDLLPKDKNGKRYNLAFDTLTFELQNILLEPNQQALLRRIHLCDSSYFLDPVHQGFHNAIAHVGAYRTIVLIDYLQLLPKSDHTHNLRENFNATLAFLKNQINTLNANPKNQMMLILLSQVSRATQQNTFNFRESSEIENIADSALILEYDSSPKSHATGRGKEKVLSLARNLRLIKNKDGAKATFAASMSSDIPFFHHIDIINQRYTDSSSSFKVTSP
jgi:DnaB-like helicase C terminal domain